MPWKAVTMEELRREMCRMIGRGEHTVSSAAKAYGLSRPTVYKWLERYQILGAEGLSDRSRRPHGMPLKTEASLEERVLELRDAHPAWGGRKLHHVLLREGVAGAPCASTITGILRRHGRLDAAEASKHRPWQRFERAQPNELWQMDFKGHVPCLDGRCHPLTVVDDCSRFSVALAACDNQKTPTVQRFLTQAFERYGLPWQMLMDNGSPWGSDAEHPYTQLGVWLMRLGIVVTHGRPYHPQTQGKEERFHRTLKAELLGENVPWALPECQRRFDAWRDIYNWKRPHEALGMAVPGERYSSSPRPLPSQLPPIEYASGDHVRKVQQIGFLFFRGHPYRISKAFARQHVALRQHPDNEHIFEVYFCTHKIANINAKEKTVN